MIRLGPQYYFHLYILLVTVLSLVYLGHYSAYQPSRLNNKKESRSLDVVILLFFFTFLIGLRPVSGVYFVDMSSYSSWYSFHEGDPFVFNWSADNIIFDNYLLLLASYSLPQGFFFLSIAFIYFSGIAWACTSLFPRDKMTAFLVCLGAFSTYSYSTNGIKAGAAASIFLIAIALYNKRKLLWAFIFAIISFGFHHSMIVPFAAFVLCNFVRNSKLFFAFWVFSLLIAVLHVDFFQHLFAGFVNEQGAIYLSGDNETIRKDILGGFRLDFVLYSAAPIIVGWFAVYKKRIASKEFRFLLNMYLVTNSIWLLCMYAEFTNRIAYLSWFMLPIVLIYPLLNEEWGRNQFKTFQWVALGHLGFTLFMQYIIY